MHLSTLMNSTCFPPDVETVAWSGMPVACKTSDKRTPVHEPAKSENEGKAQDFV